MTRSPMSSTTRSFGDAVLCIDLHLLPVGLPGAGLFWRFLGLPPFFFVCKVYIGLALVVLVSSFLLPLFSPR
jgi:hypothetical protein